MKKKQILLTGLGSASLVLPMILSSSASNVNSQNLNTQSEEKSPEQKEQELINSLQENSNSAFIVKNDIRIYKPMIAGPEELLIKRQDNSEQFDPLNYGYFVYDSLDSDINNRLELTGDNVDLTQEGTYNITISATNKYKLKTSKQFVVKVVNENVYNQKTSFIYSPYGIHANDESMGQINSIYAINTDWQLLLPVVVKKGQKIKIQKISDKPSQLRPNDNGPEFLDNLTIIKLPASSQKAIDDGIKNLSQGLPIFEYNVFNKQGNQPGTSQENLRQSLIFDKSTKTYTESNSSFDYDAVYLIKTKIDNFFTDQEKYKISIIDKQDQVINTLDNENKKVSVFIDKESDNLDRENNFISNWKKVNGPAIIKNKAVQWVLTNEDLSEIVYRGAKPDNGKGWKYESVKPEWIKETNKYANKMLSDFKKLSGIYNDVSHGKYNLHINASTLAFSFKIGVPADAVARNNIGIWQNNNKFSINYKPDQNRENWLQGMWINNRDNDTKLPDFLKHELAHIYQMSGLSNDGFTEVSNIFFYLYTDFQDKVEEERINQGMSLPLSERDRKALENYVWKNYKYYSSFPTTLYNPLLDVYDDVIVKNPQFTNQFFDSRKVNNYNDMRHTIFPKVFSKFGWEALTYVWTKYREVKSGQSQILGFDKNNSSAWDYYIYFLSEYAKRDLSNFFEHYGVKASEEIKNLITLQNWIPEDSVNSVSNSKWDLKGAFGDRIFNSNSLTSNSELYTKEENLNLQDSATLNIEIKTEDFEKLKNKKLLLISSDDKNTMEIRRSRIIDSKYLTFPKLKNGVYKLLIPDFVINNQIVQFKNINISIKSGENQYFVLESENVNKDTFKEWENIKNERNSESKKEYLKTYTKKLIEIINNSVILFETYPEFFTFEIEKLKFFKSKIEELQINDNELISQINALIEKTQKEYIVLSNLDKLTITLPTNKINFQNDVLNKIDFISTINSNNTRKARLKDISYTNIPVFSEIGTLPSGTYNIIFKDEKSQTKEIIVEVN